MLSIHLQALMWRYFEIDNQMDLLRYYYTNFDKSHIAGLTKHMAKVKSDRTKQVNNHTGSKSSICPIGSNKTFNIFWTVEGKNHRLLLTLIVYLA